ncbi:MAG: VCBS repeat-containing protein [Deltaproteobacteria bacterium]|jgi:hypothetical protein|nr:VCBS repeat-containing protein [Deltaproteobacteria bacterium]
MTDNTPSSPRRVTARTLLTGVVGVLLLVGAGALLSRRSTTPPADPASVSVTPEPTAPAAARFTLERVDSGLPRAGQWRHGFAVVDFDGDGHLDVVHGPARKSPSQVPQIFLGDGHGRFEQTTRFTFPALPYDYGDVAVADFDGDGVKDLALAVHLTGLVVLVRRADVFEVYGPPLGVVQPSIIGAFSSRAIEAVDWNADGRMDVIAESDGPRPFERSTDPARRPRGMLVLLGVVGGFEPLWPVTDLAGHGDSLAIADVDPVSPGLEIVAAANTVGSANVLYRTTEAGLALGTLPGLTSDRVVRAVALAPHADGMRVLVGGLMPGAEGLEGVLECVLPGSATATRLFTGRPLMAITAIGSGDLDGDGALEVVAGEEDGTLHVFTSRGAELTADAVQEPEARLAGCTPFGVVFANVDGQPGDELLVSYAGDDDACPSAGGIELFRPQRN